MKTIRTLALTACLLPAAVLATTAQAALILEISDGTTTQTVNGADGMVAFVGAVGAFNFNVVGGFSNAGSGQAPAVLDLSSLNVSSTGGGTLTVKLTATDYEAAPESSGRALSSVGGVLDRGAQALFTSYIDTGNTEFGTGAQLAELAFTGGGAFSGSSETGIDFTGPYSITLIAQLTHAGAGNSSYNFETRVSEPGTLALLGLGLLGLGLMMRRRVLA